MIGTDSKTLNRLNSLYNLTPGFPSAPFIKLGTNVLFHLFVKDAHKTHPDILSGEKTFLSFFFKLVYILHYIHQSHSSILYSFSVDTFKACILLSLDH